MKIPFEDEYRKKYYHLLDQVFDSNMWSDGKVLRTFEERFGNYVQLGAKGVANGGLGLLAILDFLDVKDKEVVVPANTFWATALSVKKAGGKVIYADCNRSDLCLSYEDLVKKVTPRTRAVIVVHIGGHIAFEIEKIADYCREKKIHLIEDCAHAHGAEFNGKMAGSWGFAGSYSFYATKTMPMGEGGMVVSKDANFLDWVGKYRNYGKEVLSGKVTYPVESGFNFRMNEFNAALGIIQLERLPGILEWKRTLAQKFDQIFDRRVNFPTGMKSGFYKYIVFEKDIRLKTGKVYDSTDQCHNIERMECNLPNTQWVAENHQCPPIWLGWENAGLPVDQIRKILK